MIWLNRRRRPIPLILSRFCNVCLQHSSLRRRVLRLLLNGAFGSSERRQRRRRRDTACALTKRGDKRGRTDGKTIAELRHADFPSSFLPSVISRLRRRRRRQKSESGKGIHSSLTALAIAHYSSAARHHLGEVVFWSNDYKKWR